MNVLITAGGTTEKIDSVRGITNHSTGAMGANLAYAFVEAGCEVFYIRSKTAIKPSCCIANQYIIDDTSSLEATILDILSKHKIHIIIHAMAVSDYAVASVKASCGADLTNSHKIISSHEEINITLTKTKKIISILRPNAPNAVIIGFKLTSGKSECEMMDIAYQLLLKNQLDYVLANDAANVGDSHKGWLIDKNKNHTTHIGKDKIAQAIVGVALPL